MIDLQEFTVGKRIDNDNFNAVATVIVDKKKGYYVRGQYNITTNTFHPTILGDPYELEEHYSDIAEAVEKR
jgi:hypothetical protein